MNGVNHGPMKVEGEINAALKMLGETQAPAMLVSRMHRGLATAITSQRARRSRRFLIPAAGLVMAALVLVAIFIQRNYTSAVETARMVAATPLVQATTVPLPASVATDRADEGKRLVQHSTKRRSPRSRESRRAINLLSYPLTRQEKLLLQFAHNAKPADLQALNPEYQAKVEAQQDAEFAAYLKSGSSSDAESSTQTTESTQE